MVMTGGVISGGAATTFTFLVAEDIFPAISEAE